MKNKKLELDLDNNNNNFLSSTVLRSIDITSRANVTNSSNNNNNSLNESDANNRILKIFTAASEKDRGSFIQLIESSPELLHKKLDVKFGQGQHITMHIMNFVAAIGWVEILPHLINIAQATNNSIDVLDSNGMTPLMIAANNGHIDVVKLLLESGAIVDNPDFKDWSKLKMDLFPVQNVIGNDSGVVYLNPRQTALEKTFPKQFEYCQMDKLFEYVFPEGNDKTLYENDLYKSGYWISLINKLMDNIRKTTDLSLARKSFPTSDVIIKLLDAPTYDLDPSLNQDPSKVMSLGKYLKSKINNIYDLPALKVVVIFPFQYNMHAHSAVIHLDKTKPEVIISAFINNPYGIAHIDEQTVNNFKVEIKEFIKPRGLCDETKFSLSATQEDIQGFNYDYNNCAVITIYNIEQYIFHAQTNSRIEEYNIPSIVFDQFQDQELNKSLHKAFMLRLKIDQLNRVNVEEFDLGFADEVNSNFKNPIRTRKAIEDAKGLHLHIVNSALNHYEKFSDSFKLNFTVLDFSTQIKLLNLITTKVIQNVSKNIINPDFFSVILQSYTEFVIKKDISSIPDKLHEFMDKASHHTLLNISSLLLGLPIKQFNGQGTELIRIVKQGNYDDYIHFINSLRTEEIQTIINIQDVNGQNALIHAILKGEILIVKDLVKKGANTDLKSNSYQVGIKSTGMELSALEVSAFEANNIEIFKFLLETIKKQDSFVKKITSLLKYTIAAWNEYSEKFQSEDISFKSQFMSTIEKETPSGRCQIIDLLLSEGADPFHRSIMHYSFDMLYNNLIQCTGSNTFELISFSQPSIGQIFLKHFPDKKAIMLSAAITNKNLKLVQFIINNSQNQLSKGAIKVALNKIEFLLKDLDKEATLSKQKQSPFSNDIIQNNNERISIEQLKSIKKLLEDRPQSLQLYFNKNFHTLLIKVAKNGITHEVKSLLKMGSIKNIDMFNEKGFNALLWATKNGHYETVICLLEHKASMDAISSEGIPPAGYSISFPNILQYLLENNFITSNNTRISEGSFDLLNFAISKNAIEALRLLLQFQPSFESIQKASILAAKFGRLECVKLLIETGAKINELIDENSVLIEAAKNGRLTLVQELLDVGADINICNKSFGTPLMAAAKQGHHLIVKELIMRGANINVAIITIFHPFDAKKSILSTSTKIIFDRNDEPLQGDEIRTAFTESIQYYKEIALTLIEAGAKFDFDHKGYFFKHMTQDLVELLKFSIESKNNSFITKKILSYFKDLNLNLEVRDTKEIIDALRKNGEIEILLVYNKVLSSKEVSSDNNFSNNNSNNYTTSANYLDNNNNNVNNINSNITNSHNNNDGSNILSIESNIESDNNTDNSNIFNDPTITIVGDGLGQSFMGL